MVIKKGYYVECIEEAIYPGNRIGRVIDDGDDFTLLGVCFFGWYLGHSCGGILKGKDENSGWYVPKHFLKVINLEPNYKGENKYGN